MADDSAHGVQIPSAKTSGSKEYTDVGADNGSDQDVPRFTVPVDSENK